MCYNNIFAAVLTVLGLDFYFVAEQQVLLAGMIC